MSLEIVSLGDLLQAGLEEKKIQLLLEEFKTLPNYRSGDTHDVEKFLVNNSIQYQKMGLATTHLIYSSYKEKNVLVGYFAIANKPLVLNSRTYNGLSKSQQKKFSKIGYRLKAEDGKQRNSDLIIPSFLIGQLGKNYSEEALKTKIINGFNILALAEDTIKQAISVVNGKYIWLECKPSEKLINFYLNSGYTQIADYKDQHNNLCVFIKKIF